MDLRVRGSGPTGPFLGARDRFETECDLDLPVHVQIRDDPDERTWAGHYEDRHVLNISRKAATSALARELALHEFAHMARYEEAHPSHVQSTEEALYLALAGKRIERRKLAHCYQIANHMKDIYADDITLTVGPGEKLLAFLESSLAAAVADHAPQRPGGGWFDDDRKDAPSTGTATTYHVSADPDITAVNAAFALALAERHDLIAADHRLYDLADVAAADAPEIDLPWFRTLFRELASDPDESSYRQSLVEATRSYAGTATGGRAAD